MSAVLGGEGGFDAGNGIQGFGILGPVSDLAGNGVDCGLNVRLWLDGGAGIFPGGLGTDPEMVPLADVPEEYGRVFHVSEAPFVIVEFDEGRFRVWCEGKVIGELDVQDHSTGIGLHPCPLAFPFVPLGMQLGQFGADLAFPVQEFRFA